MRAHIWRFILCTVVFCGITSDIAPWQSDKVVSMNRRKISESLYSLARRAEIQTALWILKKKGP
jgi:hypothetical protein